MGKRNVFIDYKSAFDEIINSSGEGSKSDYSNILAHIKNKYDNCVDSLKNTLNNNLIENEIRAREVHAFSTAQIYQKREIELKRRIEEIRKKLNQKKQTLEIMKKTEYKLKTEPDVIEFDPDSDI